MSREITTITVERVNDDAEESDDTGPMIMSARARANEIIRFALTLRSHRQELLRTHVGKSLHSARPIVHAYNGGREGGEGERVDEIFSLCFIRSRGLLATRYAPGMKDPTSPRERRGRGRGGRGGAEKGRAGGRGGGAGPARWLLRAKIHEDGRRSYWSAAEEGRDGAGGGNFR